MILAVDIGNTNIVLGVVDGRTIRYQARMATDTVKTSDQYCVEIKNILSLYDVSVSEIEGVIIASVVPPVLNSFRTAIRKLTGKNAMIVGPGMKTGLNLLIDNPKSMGADRIVDAVAGLHEYGGPLIVIDMGTATTISATNRSGAYLGGCICPGVKISLDALTNRAAQLPAISLGEPRSVIGKNTVDSMQSGVMIGAAAMLDGMIERMEQELGEPATVVLTGGVSKFIRPMCKRQMIYDKDLLLKGLVILYYNNLKD